MNWPLQSFEGPLSGGPKNIFSFRGPCLGQKDFTKKVSSIKDSGLVSGGFSGS